jgi:hypothetical protein
MTTRQKVASKALGVFVAAVLATSCIRVSAQAVPRSANDSAGSRIEPVQQLHASRLSKPGLNTFT